MTGVDRPTAARRPGRWWRRSGWSVLAPGRLALVGALLAGTTGALAGGPVAAVAAGVYGGLGIRAVLRRRVRLATTHQRRQRLDDLGGLAADLRAGLPPPDGPLISQVGAQIGNDGSAGALDRLVGAAVRLAEQTGAPLADLLDRIAADARATDRGLVAAQAQAAGARATAMLLAGLPVGGVALGYAIGVDPLAVLLYTPVGAGCAFGAMVLQLAGLAWAARLSAPPRGGI